MKYKFKKIWGECKDGVALGIGLFALLGVILIPSWGNHNEEKDTPMELTSEKSIRAESFDYKGHQYILFERSSPLGSSSVLHNPDCRKCKLTQ